MRFCRANRWARSGKAARHGDLEGRRPWDGGFAETRRVYFCRFSLFHAPDRVRVRYEYERSPNDDMTNRRVAAFELGHWLGIGWACAGHLLFALCSLLILGGRKPDLQRRISYE